MTEPRNLVRTDDPERLKQQEERFGHPMNPAAEMRGSMLGRIAGLQRLGVNVVRVPPGKEAFIAHRHHCEEEFMFVLSGRAVVELDGKAYELGPGDFVGYPTPSITHHLRNPFEEELVYLSGGENRDTEIADYPFHGKRLIKAHGKAVMVPLEGETAFGMEKL